jgi:hypothetical protein
LNGLIRRNLRPAAPPIAGDFTVRTPVKISRVTSTFHERAALSLQPCRHGLPRLQRVARSEFKKKFDEKIIAKVLLIFLRAARFDSISSSVLIKMGSSPEQFDSANDSPLRYLT